MAEDVAIDLFASRPLASGFRGGSLFINAGSPDFVKYVDGGMRNDWIRGVQVPADDQGQPAKTASLVQGLAAQLYFPVDSDAGGITLAGESLEIHFTAKAAVDKQLVSIFLNENKVGDLSMPTRTWQSYTIVAPKASVVEGENKLRFYFRSSAELAGYRSAAAFQSFSIGAGADASDAFVSRSYLAEGRAQTGLVAEQSARISYYLRVPKGETRLVFDVAGSATFQVAVRAQDRERKQILAGKASASWREHGTDLASYAGQVVRMDFLSDGPIAWSRLRIARPARQEKRGKIHPPQRIILFSISSFRSDRLHTEAARNLRRFVDTGFGIEGMQAAVPSAGGAHSTLMSGRLTTRASIPEETSTMAELLRSAGYATALISGNGFVSDEAGYAQGFGYYDNPMRRQHHAGAKTLWRQAKRFLLDHREQRSFIHIAAVEPHLPYRPSDEALARQWSQPALFSGAKTIGLSEQIASGRRVASAQEQAFVRALYNATIADVDEAFEEMLDELAEMHLDGETAIVLAGDHGEELWERGRFGHTDSLHQEVLLTPFAIQCSELAGRKAPKTASSADIKATIVDLAGIEPEVSGQGVSLLSGLQSLDERPLVSGLADGSRALVFDRFKLIEAAAGGVELYDLASDPAEQKNLASDLPVVVRALRIMLATAIAYEEVWGSERWGEISAPLEAFASDQGM